MVQDANASAPKVLLCIECGKPVILKHLPAKEPAKEPALASAEENSGRDKKEHVAPPTAEGLGVPKRGESVFSDKVYVAVINRRDVDKTSALHGGNEGTMQHSKQEEHFAAGKTTVEPLHHNLTNSLPRQAEDCDGNEVAVDGKEADVNMLLEKAQLVKDDGTFSDPDEPNLTFNDAQLNQVNDEGYTIKSSEVHQDSRRVNLQIKPSDPLSERSNSNKATTKEYKEVEEPYCCCVCEDYCHATCRALAQQRTELDHLEDAVIINTVTFKKQAQHLQEKELEGKKTEKADQDMLLPSSLFSFGTNSTNWTCRSCLQVC